MDSRKLTLTVVVISWNQLALLQRLVDQLLNQSFERSRYEIIVVDDGSTDGSREWLQSLPSDKVRVLLGAEDRGRAASRNKGIRAAQGDVVVMLDGDHTIEPDFLAVHAARHERERCVIVGKSDFAEQQDLRALNHYLNGGGAAKMPPDFRLPGRYFLTRDCSVPRDLLLEVGLFDERFRAWGGEDLDLGVRLEESGVPIYGEPRALAIHHHHRPLSDLLAQLEIYGRDSIPTLLERHPQLFHELNLDRTFTTRTTPSRFGPLYRFLFRLWMSEGVYRAFLAIAHVFRRRRLPRAIFDYLHLRQYTRGYGEYLHDQKSERQHGDSH
jgi:glycosyltransferase involved in cell wall biosynthesis